MSAYELVIKGGDVVIPYVGVQRADIGVKEGKIAAIEAEISADDSRVKVHVIPANEELVIAREVGRFLEAH